MTPTQEWTDFAREIRARTGLDLAAYKPEQMQRRLAWLMQRANVGGYGDYVDLLDSRPEKLHELRDYLTINVSEFFRSPAQFDWLAIDVIPRLLAARPRLRVWSAGCSYGAEAYSLAMLLGNGHYILGTDVDEAMLARARAADAFSAQDVKNVPDAFRELFEPGRDESLRLRADVRSRVTFGRHDLLADVYETDFDLILCRNVMMYFTTEAKAQVFGRLYDALRLGGILFVGSAEALAVPRDSGFVHEQLAFYRK